MTTGDWFAACSKWALFEYGNNVGLAALLFMHKGTSVLQDLAGDLSLTHTNPQRGVY